MELPKRIGAAWDRLVGAARRTIPETTPGERVADWAECARSVRELFAAHAGLQVVGKRLVIPPDYATFMEWVGGGWKWRAGLEQSLFPAADVAAGTSADYRQLVTERDEDDGPQDDGFWLRIGRYSDKHDTLLCCDRAHRLYGQVLDGHDDHPWLNGLSSPFCTIIAESFVAWLEDWARRAQPTSELSR